MNTNSEKVHFGMVFDKNVVEIGLIAAISLFRTSVSRVIHLHIVCDNIQQDVRKRMHDILEYEKGSHTFGFSYVDTHELCADLPEAAHLTRATYVRLFFPQLFPEVERIMYLDTDVLVLEDITEDAVQEFDQDIAAAPGTGGEHLNAGIMIIDLDKVRQSGLFQQALDWVRNHREDIRLCDQDALRAVIKKNFYKLPPALNVMRRKPGQTPKILHYAGKGLKPHTWKGFAWDDRHGIGASPWIDFRETTVMAQGKLKTIGLKLSQMVSMTLRILIFRPQKNISRSVRKRWGLIKNKSTEA